jgi:hypothetical protein
MTTKMAPPAPFPRGKKASAGVVELWDHAEANKVIAPAVELVSRPGYRSADPAVFRQQVATGHAVDDAWLAKDMAGLRLAMAAFLRLFTDIEATRTEPVM